VLGVVVEQRDAGAVPVVDRLAIAGDLVGQRRRLVAQILLGGDADRLAPGQPEHQRLVRLQRRAHG